jgi:hypothetical protein
MLSREESGPFRILLGLVVPLVLVNFILRLCGYEHRGFGDPAIIWIVLLIWIVNSFFLWKNKKELLKRCALALPFALLAVILLRLTVFGPYGYSTWWAGILLFILLTTETKGVKGAFVVCLVVGIILISLLTILIIFVNSTLGWPAK